MRDVREIPVREIPQGADPMLLGRLLHWVRSLVPSSRLPRRTVRFRLTVLYAALFLLSGGVLLGVTYTLVKTFVSPPPASITRSGDTVTITKANGSRVVLSAGSPLVAAYKQADAQAGQQLDADRNRLFVVFGVALVVMAALSTGLGWWVAGRILRRLQTITKAARDISAANLHERLALAGPDDELKTLGDTFDEFLGRLEATFEAQRRFVANASHELRTPLAMMRTSVEVAEAKPEPVPPEVHTLAAKVREGLDQADELLEGLLALARAQQGDRAAARPQDSERVPLASLVANALDAHRDAIEEKHVRVEQGSGQAEVEGSASAHWPAVNRRRIRVMLRAGELELDPLRRTVTRKGRELALSVKEFAVLEALMMAMPGTLSAEALLEQAWTRTRTRSRRRCR